jgi:cysteine synthase
MPIYSTSTETLTIHWPTNMVRPRRSGHRLRERSRLLWLEQVLAVSPVYKDFLLTISIQTGGTITGLARGLRKHNKNIKIIAADPNGSILALPESLNRAHANESYKVEGIGYDFIPGVLDRDAIDVWYKTDDRESFEYARRLIEEEGLLVGGSSGSAIAAMLRGVKDLGLGKGDIVVVILPDSIRSYLSKVKPWKSSHSTSY